MATNKQRLLDLLAMGRVANLPTVVSNVLVGCVLGIWVHNGWTVPHFVIPCLAGCLLYLGGCFLNDWKDAGWDREHKPSRPIPKARWSQGSILLVSSFLLVGGAGVASLLGLLSTVVALLVVTSIILYTWIHKRTKWAILPMGLCRALLYVLGFAAQTSLAANTSLGLIGGSVLVHDTYIASYHLADLARVLLVPSLGLLSYIAGLSLLARFEATGTLPHTNRVAALCLLLLPALTHSSVLVLEAPLLAFLGTLPFVACVLIASRLIKRSIEKGVSLLLAGIALLDLVILVPITLRPSSGLSSLQDAPSPSFALAALMAFGLALVLQRVAPAT